MGQYTAKARNLNPIDDIFFNKMGESPEVCEEIISTILQFPVKVLKVVPQDTIASLQGRGVRLDALVEVMPGMHVEAELLQDCPIGEKGARINIEVQKDDNDDHQKRVLFNAAAVLLNETSKGTKQFRDVPDVVVIFISKFDLFKKGRMMEIFVDSDRYDYQKFPKTSERKNQFKNTEEGVRAMDDWLQELIDRKEQEATVNHIRSIMAKLKCTVDQAMDALNIPPAQRDFYAGLVGEEL